MSTGHPTGHLNSHYFLWWQNLQKLIEVDVKIIHSESKAKFTIKNVSIAHSVEVPAVVFSEIRVIVGDSEIAKKQNIGPGKSFTCECPYTKQERLRYKVEGTVSPDSILKIPVKSGIVLP